MSLAHTWHIWTGGDIMDILWSYHYLAFYLILMKAQQEITFICLLLQLRRRSSAATSVTHPVFISTPSSAANNTYLDEIAQPRLCWERVLCKGWWCMYIIVCILYVCMYVCILLHGYLPKRKITSHGMSFYNLFVDQYRNSLPKTLTSFSNHWGW